MDITLAMSGEIPVLSLSGRLDATSAPLLEERLKPLLEEMPGSRHRLVFEGSELSYVSSAGLRVFLMVQRQLAARGGGVAFARMTPPVLDLFRLAGLQNLFAIEDSVEAAARHLS